MNREKAITKYRALRRKLLSRGLNLKSFAESRGYPVSTVYHAAYRARGGVVSTTILNELEEVANG